MSLAVGQRETGEYKPTDRNCPKTDWILGIRRAVDLLYPQT